jgi:predicted acetyltransferase
MHIQRLKESDFDEAMDFINMVFSMACSPTDIAKTLPRLYKPTDECMNCNFVVRENGRIRALAGLYTNFLQAGDETLKLGGIGAVSSHPNDRNKGWMKLLMDRCIEEMQQAGFDLSYLNGLRHRYKYFEYEKSGILLEHKINKSNLKHSSDAYSLQPYRFELMQASDLGYIQKAKELYDVQSNYCIRKADEFYLYVSGHCMHPWVALDAGGNMVGYCVANPEQNKIAEIFAESGAALAAMIRSWFMQHNVQEISVIASQWCSDNERYLGGIAEDVRVTSNGNWRIFNWQKVIQTLLRVKNSQQHLADGAFCLGISQYGNIKIYVHRGIIGCERTSEQSDVEWDNTTATRILFGHIPPPIVTDVSEAVESLASSWFPLPLNWQPMNFV